MTERPMPLGPLVVTHLIKGLGPGGAERLVVNQVSTSHADDIEYRVVSLVPHKDHLVDELRSLGVAVSVLGDGPSWPIRLRPELADAQVVHCHSPLLAGVARVLTRTIRPRPIVITTEHNRWPRHHPATRLLNRLTVPLDDTTVAVSEDVRSSMTTKVSSRVRVVTHGIDRSAVRPDAGIRAAMRAELGLTDEFCIGIVANFRPEKAYDTFVAALERLLELAADRGAESGAGTTTRSSGGIHAVIVGQGPGETELRSDISDRGLDGHVTLTGYRADATAVMQAFDCFSLSSRHEGLPVSLMEAMTLGLPIAVTAAGGIPEAIEPGVSGLIVPIDDVEALARAWLRVMDDPSDARRLGQAAAEASTAFDAARSTEELESLYRRSIDAAESGGVRPADRS